MNSVKLLRQAITRVFREWEEFASGPLSHFRIMPVIDLEHDRYVLQDVDPSGDRYRSLTMAHLEIRDGKIWILTDNTEEGVATQLVAQGVPKDRIVLAFYPQAVRAMGEFAVA